MFACTDNRGGKILLALLSENADEQQLEHCTDLRISPRFLFLKRCIACTDECEFFGGDERRKKHDRRKMRVLQKLLFAHGGINTEKHLIGMDPLERFRVVYPYTEE